MRRNGMTMERSINTVSVSAHSPPVTRMIQDMLTARVESRCAVSLAFALLSKNTMNERVRYAVWAFLAFLVVAIGIGWLMYPFSH